MNYTNVLRREHGYTNIKAALVEAGRVRPILRADKGQPGPTPAPQPGA